MRKDQSWSLRPIRLTDGLESPFAGMFSIRHSIGRQCGLLHKRASLFPSSWIENRAINLANSVASKSNPRVIAALHVEFIFRKSRHGRRLASIKIKDRPTACCLDDELAVRDAVRGDRLAGKGNNERIGLSLPGDFELDRGVDRT